MALISCPECKKKISDTCYSCPHCGYVLRDRPETSSKHIVIENYKGDKKKWPKPSEDQTVFESLSKRKKVICITWLIIGAICLLIGFITIATHNGVLMGIMFGVGALSLIIALLGACLTHVVIRKKDGYQICVYAGWFLNVLCIDNQIVQKTLSRNLYGDLPNEKSVWVQISIWDNSIKVGIGSDGDEKQII